MNGSHWFILLAALAVGYFIGYKFPRFGAQLGI